MVGVREHVDGLYVCNAIFSVQERQVARLRRRVTAHIDQDFGRGIQDHFYHIFMHAGSWRVDDHHIRSAMSLHKFVGQNILHVAGIEEGIVDAIHCRVDACISYRLFHIFDADDLACVSRHKVGYRACAGIEVVDQRQHSPIILVVEPGKPPCHLIQLVGLT